MMLDKKDIMSEIDIKCFMCHKHIDKDTQIFYVFVSLTVTDGNEPFCTDCYLKDIKENTIVIGDNNHRALSIYANNFVRMNK